MKLIIAMAVLIAAFATAAAAGPKIGASFGTSAQVSVGKNSVGHGSAAAVNIHKSGMVNVQGATATEIDLGKVKVNNQAQGGAKFPMQLLMKRQ